MAKISANVAAFALIALSIGFNIWRYPVVWDMAGGSPCLSQSNQSAPSAAMTEPNKSAAPTVALQTVCPRLPGGKQCELTEGRWPDRTVEPADMHVPEPVAIMGVRPCLPAGERCELTECTGSDEIVAHRITGRLVRVVRPMGNPNEACPPESEPQVVRLPSVDRIAPVPASRSLPSFAEHQPLSYPATGIE